MRKIATVGVLMVALLLTVAPSSDAWSGHHHHRGGARVFIGFGGFYPYYPYPYYPYPYYPYWYYPPPYYTYSPPVVVQEPPVYVQQQATVQPQQPAQAAPAAPSTPEAYWYYCPSARGYYPSVQTCSEPWVKVPPRQD